MADEREEKSLMPRPAVDVLRASWEEIETLIMKAHDDALAALNHAGQPADQAQNDALSVVGQLASNAVLTLILGLMRDKGLPPQIAESVAVQDIMHRVRAGLAAAVVQNARAEPDEEKPNG